MTAEEIDISIVVPVYGSASILPELAKRVNEAMQVARLRHELILVDDASPDASWDSIIQVCHTYPHVTGVRLARNRGQWYAALLGMGKAVGKYIVTIDDDLEYAPEDIQRLYETAQEKQHPVVFGLAEEKYAVQGKNTRVAHWRNRLLNFVWNKGVTDSFKIVRRDLLFADGRFLPDVHFEAFLASSVHRSLWGYVPVRFHRRFAGRSNYTWGKKVRLLGTLSLHYVRKPFAWMMAASLVSALLAALSFYRPWVGWLLPLPLALAFLCVLALRRRYRATEARISGLMEWSTPK